jgi:glyoxylase-like metal-dependent hydrolase (beta-lactamase superfamily II)
MPARARARTVGDAMATTAQEVQPGLYLIPGHHPVSMWTDANVPNIMAVHAGETLYLLDSGLGPEQRQAIVDLAAGLRGRFGRLLLLNSHGHADHLGNNDVLGAIEASDKQHYISELSAPYYDPVGFFRDAYNEGARYFDYLQGLDLSVDALLPLLVRAGLDPATDPTLLADLGRRIGQLGLTRVISHYAGDLLMRNVVETYPPIHLSLETMTHYETLPRRAFEYGDARWSGWQLGDVCVFEAHGHTPDGVLFYLPEHKFLFFADETTPIPVWKDTDTDNTARSLRNALAMVDAGAVEAIGAGHFPLELVQGADAIRQTLTGLLEQKTGFDREVCEAVSRFPTGVAIDDLYATLCRQPTGVVARLAAGQFPKMPSFLKLTLLNYCRRHCTQAQDDRGRPVFRMPS